MTAASRSDPDESEFSKDSKPGFDCRAANAKSFSQAAVPFVVSMGAEPTKVTVKMFNAQRQDRTWD